MTRAQKRRTQIKSLGYKLLVESGLIKKQALETAVVVWVLGVGVHVHVEHVVADPAVGYYAQQALVERGAKNALKNEVVERISVLLFKIVDRTVCREFSAELLSAGLGKSKWELGYLRHC